jgi:hypothetical protein
MAPWVHRRSSSSMDPLSSCPGLLTGEVGRLGCGTGEGCTREAGKVGGGGGGGWGGVVSRPGWEQGRWSPRPGWPGALALSGSPL